MIAHIRKSSWRPGSRHLARTREVFGVTTGYNLPFSALLELAAHVGPYDIQYPITRERIVRNGNAQQGFCDEPFDRSCHRY